MTRFGWTIAILVVTLLGGAWTLASRVAPDAAAPAGLPPAPQVGFAAPDFTADGLAPPYGDGSGLTVRLADLRGTPVVLNFWATWCPPCLQELPHLKAAAAAYAGRVTFAGIDDAEALPVVTDFVRREALGYLIVLDPAAAITDRYRVDGLPTTFFVDRDGIIRDMTVGPLTAASLEDKLGALLSAP